MARLVVDTDPGVDDALTLLYFSSLEEVDISSVTVILEDFKTALNPWRKSSNKRQQE